MTSFGIEKRPLLHHSHRNHQSRRRSTERRADVRGGDMMIHRHRRMKGLARLKRCETKAMSSIERRRRLWLHCVLRKQQIVLRFV
eukprot:symbB.v1.2.032481.t1/scaffold3904.1/size48501/3